MPIIEGDDMESIENLQENHLLLVARFIFENMEPTLATFAQERCSELNISYYDNWDRWLFRGRNSIRQDTIIQVCLDCTVCLGYPRLVVRIEAGVFKGKWVYRYSNARPEDNRILVEAHYRVDSSLLNQQLQEAIAAVSNSQ